MTMAQASVATQFRFMKVVRTAVVKPDATDRESQGEIKGGIVTVHGPGLAHFSRDQSPAWNDQKLFKRLFVEKNVPVPLHWHVNGYEGINLLKRLLRIPESGEAPREPKRCVAVFPTA